MPQGKPANIRCVQLTLDNKCKLFNDSNRPLVCCNLKPSVEMCGTSFDEAMAYLTFLEKATKPDNI
jgi:hypothetical protein